MRRSVPAEPPRQIGSVQLFNQVVQLQHLIEAFGRHRGRLYRARDHRAVAWRLAGDHDAGLDLLRDRLTYQRTTRAREPSPMTWDQIVVWLIVPAIGTIIVSGGAVWLSRRIP